MRKNLCAFYGTESNWAEFKRRKRWRNKIVYDGGRHFTTYENEEWWFYNIDDLGEGASFRPYIALLNQDIKKMGEYWTDVVEIGLTCCEYIIWFKGEDYVQ